MKKNLKNIIHEKIFIKKNPLKKNYIYFKNMNINALKSSMQFINFNHIYTR